MAEQFSQEKRELLAKYFDTVQELHELRDRHFTVLETLHNETSVCDYLAHVLFSLGIDVNKLVQESMVITEPERRFTRLEGLELAVEQRRQYLFTRWPMVNQQPAQQPQPTQPKLERQNATLGDSTDEDTDDGKAMPALESSSDEETDDGKALPTLEEMVRVMDQGSVA